MLHESLTSHFQPIFSASNGKVYGCEALARVCPETLMDEDGEPVAALVERLGLSHDKIIFEITEESAVHD